MVVLAAVGGLVLGLRRLSMVGIGGAAWWIYSDRSRSGDGATLTEAPEAAAPDTPARAEPAAGGAARVALEAGDPSLQWVKISDAQGRQVIKASPSGEASLEPGSYELSGKVVGRPAAKASLDVAGDAAWSCLPADEGRIRCTESMAGATLVLQP